MDVSDLLQEFPALLSRLMVFGPVLYLGLHITLNPASMARFLDTATDRIEDFSLNLRGMPWHRPSQAGHPDFRSPATLKSLRFAGLVLTAYGVACLAGIGR